MDQASERLRRKHLLLQQQDIASTDALSCDALCPKVHTDKRTPEVVFNDNVSSGCFGDSGARVTRLLFVVL